MPDGVRYISLADSLEDEWIKLPTAAMREVGPAAQTLGGVLAITNRETFAAVAMIARRARLPIPTVRKHLVKLHQHDWIDNNGREHTRSGAPRRTCTLNVTSKTRNASRDYGLLPWWACGDVLIPTSLGAKATTRAVLAWSSRAVLSVVMGRLLTLKSVSDQDAIEGFSLEEHIEALGGERFCFSLGQLSDLTGLTRHSIITAKCELARLGIIEWTTARRPDGGDAPDWMRPNWLFRVVVKPASSGACFVTLQPGCKFG